MSEGKKNIISAFFFMLISSFLLFFAFFSGSRIDEKIEDIKIEGNYLLNQNDYLNFVKLKNSRDYKNITLPVVRDRFLKHPYVKKADVKFDEKNSVRVYLVEKKIKALIVENVETFFLSSDREIFPVLPDTRFVELPVITNSSISMKRTKNGLGEDIVQAVRIINAAKLTNSKLSRDLSEINLRNGGDVILTFNGIMSPVIFGRNEEGRKMVCLDAVLNHGAGKEYFNSGDYLDVRFSNRVFIGKNNSAETLIDD